MQDLLSEFETAGYSNDDLHVEKESRFVNQMEALMDLSKQVEQATLRLSSLQNTANFEDLMDPDAVERKLQMLKTIEARIDSIVLEKDSILAFIMRNEAGAGRGLAIEASKHQAVVELFNTISSHLEQEGAFEKMLSWVSDSAPQEYEQVDDVLQLLASFQAKYQRAFEASDSFTQALEQKTMK